MGGAEAEERFSPLTDRFLYAVDGLQKRAAKARPLTTQLRERKPSLCVQMIYCRQGGTEKDGERGDHSLSTVMVVRRRGPEKERQKHGD